MSQWAGVKPFERVLADVNVNILLILFPLHVEPVAVAVGETGILLQPPLPSVGVSIAMERGRQQNDSLADGYRRGKRKRS